MSQPFNVTLTNHPSAVVASFFGAATVHTAEAFETEMLQLGQLGTKVVILDLSGLEFISSFAMGSFLKLQVAIMTGGGKLRLAAPTQYMQNLLQTTRMDQRLPVFETVEDALAA